MWRGRVLDAGFNLPPIFHPNDESLPLETQALTVFRALKKATKVKSLLWTQMQQNDKKKNEIRTQKHREKDHMKFDGEDGYLLLKEQVPRRPDALILFRSI